VQKAEYIWMDGQEGKKGIQFNEMRSKTKVIQNDIPPRSLDFPDWSFDGSRYSTWFWYWDFDTNLSLTILFSGFNLPTDIVALLQHRIQHVQILCVVDVWSLTINTRDRFISNLSMHSQLHMLHKIEVEDRPIGLQLSQRMWCVPHKLLESSSLHFQVKNCV
jgi:hypothetical protein